LIYNQIYEKGSFDFLLPSVLNNDGILEKVKNILNDIALGDDIPNDNLSLANIFDLIDSIEFINFIIKIEEQFNVEISDENLIADNFDSLSSIVSLIASMIRK
jgi:acyl carrier protein